MLITVIFLLWLGVFLLWLGFFIGLHWQDILDFIKKDKYQIKECVIRKRIKEESLTIRGGDFANWHAGLSPIERIAYNERNPNYK